MSLIANGSQVGAGIDVGLGVCVGNGVGGSVGTVAGSGVEVAGGGVAVTTTTYCEINPHAMSRMSGGRDISLFIAQPSPAAQTYVERTFPIVSTACSALNGDFVACDRTECTNMNSSYFKA